MNRPTDFLMNHSLRKIGKILKRLGGEGVNVVFKIGNMEEYEVDAYFNTVPTQIGRSVIHIVMDDSIENLRAWNACLTITTLHEYAHYLIILEMSIAEREESFRKYGAYSYYRDRDEEATWLLTAKLLKRFGYHRSSAIRNEFKHFKFPKQFKVKTILKAWE